MLLHSWHCTVLVHNMELWLFPHHRKQNWSLKQHQAKLWPTWNNSISFLFLLLSHLFSCTCSGAGIFSIMYVHVERRTFDLDGCILYYSRKYFINDNNSKNLINSVQLLCFSDMSGSWVNMFALGIQTGCLPCLKSLYLTLSIATGKVLLFVFYFFLPKGSLKPT